jgi:hypothetical protein
MLWLSSIAAFMAFSELSRAQDRGPAVAEALFREGRDASVRGDYDTACRKFRESQRLDPAIGTVLNVADCEEHSGQLASAWQHFQQAIEELGPRDDRLPLARRRLGELEKRVPHVRIALSAGTPAGSKVVLDGKELGAATLGSMLPINPGAHAIVLVAPQHLDRRLDFTLAEGESRPIVLEVGQVSSGGPAGGALAQGALAAAPVATTSDAPREKDDVRPAHDRGLRTVGYVVGSVGVASLVVGAVTGGMAIGKKNAMDSGCPGNECDETGWSAKSSGKTLATISTVTTVLGLAAGGTGLYLVLSNRDKSANESALMPMVLPGGAGLSWARSFR